VYVAGERQYACHGITSVENPLPVDQHTLFQMASTAKTFTATAVMCLADSGLIRLDERVRAYLPELRLADESVADAVIVGHLLNHTAGWDVDGEVVDTGEGDDAVAAYVASMDRLPQVAPLRSATSDGSGWSTCRTGSRVRSRPARTTGRRAGRPTAATWRSSLPVAPARARSSG
jgi:CubicO group peptidase (beta-lactamase class C family)